MDLETFGVLAGRLGMSLIALVFLAISLACFLFLVYVIATV